MNGQGHSKRRRTVIFRSITIVSLLAIAAMALGPYAVGAENPYTTISPKTNVAKDVQFLYKVIFWLALVVFIGVQFGVAFTALRYRRRHDAEPRPEQIHGNKTIEIVWTIIPAVILIAIFIPSVRTMFDYNAKAESGDYVIQVYGKQWWWEVHYAKPSSDVASAPQGVENVITANEIYVPVGHSVQVQLYTNNVIHSFWVPQLTGKMDVIPGHRNILGFTPKQAGVYYGECAEFCGDSHALMRFKVIAVDEQSFANWVTAWNVGGRTAQQAANNEVAQAPAEFAVCMGCHRVNGTNANAASVGLAPVNGEGTPISGYADRIYGPNLTDFACRTTIGAGAMPNDAQHLRDWLTDPGAVKAGNYMATVIKKDTLKPEQIDAIVKYLTTLQPEGGCIPLTGINADNVVQLANGAAAADTGATTDAGASAAANPVTAPADAAANGAATGETATAATDDIGTAA